MKRMAKFLAALDIRRYRPIVLIAWACFISVFVFGILSKLNDNNFYMAGLYATLGTIMVALTFITTALTGREK